jgi:hypothetical protein
MNTATSASIAMMYTDTATQTQYCSSLSPLTKSQITAIKAALKEEKKKKKKKKKKATGIDKAPQQQQQQQQQQQHLLSPPLPTTPTADSTTTTPIGLVVMFITVHPGCHHGDPDDKVFFLPLTSSSSSINSDKDGGGMSVEMSLHLACLLISSPKPLLVYSCQTVISSLMKILSRRDSTTNMNIQLPLPHNIRCMDPQLLSWLCLPHLIQEKTGGYSLREASYRHMSPIEEMTKLWGKNNGNDDGNDDVSTATVIDAIERTRLGLVIAMRLGEIIHGTVTQQLNIPNETVLTEIQVGMMLAEMECVGMGFDRGMLAQQSDAARVRQREIEEEIVGLAGGRRVNWHRLSK